MWRVRANPSLSPARLAAVGKLGKLLEQARHLVGGDPDAGVFHLHPERLAAMRSDAQGHASTLRVNLTALER